MLGHPAEGQQRLCSGDGRCARGLHAPRDPDRPLVCLDETSKKLVAETRVPIPMKPGRAARVDYEYEPNGTANLFMLFAPLEGGRCIKVTDRHTAIDYAHVLKDSADIHFPHAKISCSSRTISTFTARRHSTRLSRLPKRGGSLNASNGTTRPSTAAGLISQNPNLAFWPPNVSTAASPTKQTLIDEIAAWQQERNANHTKSDWHFTTKDARIKFKHLYLQSD